LLGAFSVEDFSYVGFEPWRHEDVARVKLTEALSRSGNLERTEQPNVSRSQGGEHFFWIAARSREIQGFIAEILKLATEPTISSACSLFKLSSFISALAVASLKICSGFSRVSSTTLTFLKPAFSIIWV